ncbi:phosphotriesterase [Amycolatopsis thailandensis]|uniref:phosphotriesterase family protein n=1 Tax=Amycolatopsis thailandensis TaxID=589330 RepID=UPI003661C029
MAEVRGVLGAVDAADLGLVLPHEHLFNDLSSAVAEPSYAATRRLVEAEVGPGLQFLLRQDPYCCNDNVAVKDHASVVREVTAFAAAGGGTVVDATGSAAIGRDPLALAAVAEATGVTVVMGTGAYLEKFEGERITAVTVDAQTERILAELDEGVGDTGIRAGVIGEVGVSPFFTDGERASLRAAALAQAERPAVGLNIHMPGWQRRGHEVLDLVLEECGALPAKVALAHSDPSGDDPGYQRGLLERGVLLEFDMIGLDISFPGEGVAPTVSQTARAVARWVHEGFGDQIMLSHDLFLKQMWTHNGGNGLVFVPTIFADLLEAEGVAAEAVTRLMKDVPARWLTA